MSFSIGSVRPAKLLTVLRSVNECRQRNLRTINGVNFIMGNDIAGGKVYPTPEVTNNPVVEPVLDTLSQHDLTTSCNIH